MTFNNFLQNWYKYFFVLWCKQKTWSCPSSICFGIIFQAHLTCFKINSDRNRTCDTTEKNWSLKDITSDFIFLYNLIEANYFWHRYEKNIHLIQGWKWNTYFYNMFISIYGGYYSCNNFLILHCVFLPNVKHYVG